MAYDFRVGPIGRTTAGSHSRSTILRDHTMTLNCRKHNHLLPYRIPVPVSSPLSGRDELLLV